MSPLTGNPEMFQKVPPFIPSVAHIGFRAEMISFQYLSLGLHTNVVVY